VGRSLVSREAGSHGEYWGRKEPLNYIVERKVQCRKDPSASKNAEMHNEYWGLGENKKTTNYIRVMIAPAKPLPCRVVSIVKSQ
jgi:hypothetical protein